MYLPAQFLPINTRKPKPVQREAVSFDKAESNPNSAQQPASSGVLLYDKREGEDRRKRKTKVLLDTRSGRDRRYEKNIDRIDVTA
jgi:hypothetical protein